MGLQIRLKRLFELQLLLLCLLRLNKLGCHRFIVPSCAHAAARDHLLSPLIVCLQVRLESTFTLLVLLHPPLEETLALCRYHFIVLPSTGLRLLNYFLAVLLLLREAALNLCFPLEHGLRLRLKECGDLPFLALRTRHLVQACLAAALLLLEVL